MAAQVEEIVVNADRTSPKHTLPNLPQPHFQHVIRISKRIFVRGFGLLGFLPREGTPIHLAGVGEWQHRHRHHG